MRLVTFRKGLESRLGAVLLEEDQIVDLSVAAPHLPSDMVTLVREGCSARALVEAAVSKAGAEARIHWSSVKLEAPFSQPARSIFCVGKNYREHVAEFQASGFDSAPASPTGPDFPIIFTKAASSVIGPGDPIPSGNDPCHSVDYEGEVAVVIGRPGARIPRGEAWGHVYGYTILNDVTAREIQKRHKQWFLGKSIDGFCPLGPVLVTADEIADVSSLRLTTTVNGERRQDACLRDLIFDIPALIETISAFVGLQAGDIIATGTPAGVGIGFPPPRFLKPGDVVSITVDGLGTLENPVV